MRMGIDVWLMPEAFASETRSALAKIVKPHSHQTKERIAGAESFAVAAMMSMAAQPAPAESVSINFTKIEQQYWPMATKKVPGGKRGRLTRRPRR